MKVQRYLVDGNPKSMFKEFFLYTFPLILYSPISYLLILIHNITRKKKVFKHKVSLCLIFKDEGHYLKEWIEYHKLIGIDHFYLYNNGSTDNYIEVLTPFIEEGTVTLIDFPEKYAQVKAYKDCYQRTKNDTEWLGYIDVDEFINLIKYDSIKNLLNSVKAYPSLYLNWRMFGTSGHMHENYEELTIMRYTQAWGNLSTRGKGFINNNYDCHDVTVHFHKTKFYRLPVFGILANKSFCRNLHFISSNKVSAIAYLNHYWSRSYEFQIYKAFYKGDATSKNNEEIRKISGQFEQNELRNITKDFSILRWLLPLKRKMTKQE